MIQTQAIARHLFAKSFFVMMRTVWNKLITAIVIQKIKQEISKSTFMTQNGKFQMIWMAKNKEVKIQWCN